MVLHGFMVPVFDPGNVRRKLVAFYVANVEEEGPLKQDFGKYFPHLVRSSFEAHF